MNYKLEVENLEQAKEAQSMFEKIGFEKGVFFDEYYPKLVVAKDDYSTGALLDSNHDCKKITLQQLRSMVEPKEYLTKNKEGGYSLVNHRFGDEDIEVPDGAVIAIQFYACDTIVFYDEDCYCLADGNKGETNWNMTDLLNNDINLKDDVYGCDISHWVLWQRKEYLVKDKQTGFYYVDKNPAHYDDAIEIPEGMNFAYKDEFNIHFTKLEMGYRDSVLVWQREKVEVESEKLDTDAMLADIDVQIATHSQHGHYFKDVRDLNVIDVYQVLMLFNVTDPCLQHIVKKALCSGVRGHKDLHTDMKDIHDTAIRMLAMHGIV